MSVTRETRAHVYTYLDLLWTTIFNISRLVAVDDEKNIMSAYNMLLYLIPLLPKEVKRKALRKVHEGLEELSTMKKTIEEGRSDARYKNKLIKAVGRKKLRKLIWSTLNLISDELEKLGYKKYERLIQIGSG